MSKRHNPEITSEGRLRDVSSMMSHPALAESFQEGSGTGLNDDGEVVDLDSCRRDPERLHRSGSCHHDVETLSGVGMTIRDQLYPSDDE